MAPIIASILLLSLSSCSATKAIIHSFKSLNHFIPFPADNRVLYVPDAEEFASEIAKRLPEAIERVENGHYRIFPKNIPVYACASEESFKAITGRNVTAMAYRGSIFLSPRLMHHPDSISPYLTHELSHLLLYQEIGGYKYIEVPSWCLEGLAVLVADGGGAEKVTDMEAIKAINSGKHFKPLEKAGIKDIFFPKYASCWRLEHHMFYRQGMLFVAYLQNRDKDKFKEFLLQIQDGENFAESFQQIYDMDTMQMWKEYTTQLKLKN